MLKIIRGSSRSSVNASPSSTSPRRLRSGTTFVSPSNRHWSMADKTVFAMAPLGIITALVSAVRVGGANWLKVLVGRATENLVQAELELMSSTSKESCDLWNGRAIVRCIGRPKVSEIIYAPKDKNDVSPEAFITIDPSTHQEGFYELCSHPGLGPAETPHISSLSSVGGAFTKANPVGDVESQEKKSSNEKDNAGYARLRFMPRDANDVPPNISLNTYGRSTTSEFIFFCLIAGLAQVGALLWAGLVTFRTSFTAKHCTLDSAVLKVHGFGMYLGGTVGLAISVGLCARTIDSCSQEIHWTRKVIAPHRLDTARAE